MVPREYTNNAYAKSLGGNEEYNVFPKWPIDYANNSEDLHPKIT